MPRQLSGELGPHEVDTLSRRGWSGVENGELLRRAAAAGFDVLVTADQGFEHEQNVARLPLMVAILAAPSNRLEDLEPLVPRLVAALDEEPEIRLIRIDG